MSRKLSAFFRSRVKLSQTSTPSTSCSSPSPSPSPSPQPRSAREALEVKQLKSDLSTDTSSDKPAPLNMVLCQLGNPLAATKKSSLKQTGDVTISTFNMDGGKDSDDSQRSVLRDQITGILTGDENKVDDSLLDVRWKNYDGLKNSCNHMSSGRRELTLERNRKTNVTSKNNKGQCIQSTMKMLPNMSGKMLKVITKLGMKPDVNVYNAMISDYIQKARDADDEEVAFEEICKVLELFKLMKENGFELGDNTYGQFLMLLIDMRKVQEFYLLLNLIKDQNSKSIPKLGYYEILLCARIDNTEEIRNLCEHAIKDEMGDKSDLIGNYFCALSTSGTVWEKEILLLLESIDVQKISSLNLRKDLFNCLAQLQLESFAEKFLLTLKNNDVRLEVSTLILNYTLGLPNLLVKDAIYKYRSLHEKLEVKPSSGSFGKLICYCCTLKKVYVAIELLDEMCEKRLDVLPEVLRSILRASEESDEFSLVHGIYSLICRHKLVANADIFKSLISMAIRLKDFPFAYDLLKDMELQNLQPTATMYNSIMGGYFRDGNTSQALMVLKHMEAAKVKPDSQTYCYLISNSKSVEDIAKYYKELKIEDIHFTKHIYMSLINAYVGCDHIEKAKQVISGNTIQTKDLNEIKSALVHAIAVQGHLSDALELYDEIKQGGGSLEPKSIVGIMEMFPNDRDLSDFLQLLQELENSVYWNQGCCRTIIHSFRQKNLSVTVDLIKRFKNSVKNEETAMRSMIYEVFSLVTKDRREEKVVTEEDPRLLQTGMELFRIIKNEIEFSFLRRVLDFLLNGCANARDRETARAIWKEYESNGLHYNVVSYIGMYRVLLACGDSTSAMNILKKIPQDDSQIRLILKEYKRIYGKSTSPKLKSKRKKKESKSKT